MSTPRPSIASTASTACVVVALVPFVFRADDQLLAAGALVAVAAAGLLTHVLVDRRPDRLLLRLGVAVASGLVAAVATRATLGGFVGAVVLAALLLAAPAAGGRPSRPVLARSVLLLALVGANLVLLTTDRALAPALGLLLACGLAVGLEHLLLRHPADRIDGAVHRAGEAVARRLPGAGDPAAADAFHPVALAVVAGILAAWWWGDDHQRSLVVLAVAAVVSLGCGAVPAARQAVGSVLGRTVALIGRALAFVVLVPLYLLVVTPVGLIRRALGRPTLDLGWHAAGPSYWLEHRGGAAEPLDRMFADERAWQPVAPPPEPEPEAAPEPEPDGAAGAVTPPRPPRTRRPDGSRAGRLTVIRTVAVVLVIEALLVGGYVAWERRTSPVATYSGASAPASLESAALASDPWVPEAGREAGEAAAGVVYTPYTGWSLRDYVGTYVNVQDRARASYQPDGPAGVEPLDVWFFGGSTMFGFDLQRDDHTIPSEVVRLAEADGIPIRARNFGAPGYVNYQSASLLGLLLTSGEKPDVIVFYDGTNDINSQVLARFTGLDRPGQPTDLYAEVLRQAFAGTGFVPNMTPAVPAPLEGDPVPAPTTPAAMAEAILQVYGQGAGLIDALSERYDVPVQRYWQPDAFSKATLDPGETSRLAELGVDADGRRGMRRITRAVRDRLDPETIDLGGALDELRGPILSDSVHINERGAQAVAAAMYRTLGPELRAQQPGD